MPPHNVATLFDQTLEVSPPKRAAFVKRVTKGDADLRRELEALLLAFEKAGAFLDDTEAAEAARELVSVAPVPPLAPGEAVGDFVIERELSSGAFGAVYLALDRPQERQVALKVTPVSGRETRAASPPEHPGIVPVYDERVDKRRQAHVLSMQYVPGSSLERVLAARPDDEPLNGALFLSLIERTATGRNGFDPAHAPYRQRIAAFDPIELLLWTGVQIADALAHAHRAGVLHLDVNPAKLLLTTYGRPRLVDFNAARRGKRARETALVSGTPQFLSPEQKDFLRAPRRAKLPDTLDGRADVYALGVLLTGWLRTAVPPHSVDDRTRQRIENLLGHCTAADRSSRYGSMDQAAEALQSVLERHTLGRVLPGSRGPFRIFTAYPHSTLALASFLPTIPLLVLGPRFAAEPAMASIPWLLLVGYLRLEEYARAKLPWNAPGSARDGGVRQLVLALPLIFAPLLLWGLAFAQREMFNELVAFGHGQILGKVTGQEIESQMLRSQVAGVAAAVGLALAAVLVQGAALFGIYGRHWRGETGIRRRAESELERAAARGHRWQGGLVLCLGAVGLFFFFGLRRSLPVVGTFALTAALGVGFAAFAAAALFARARLAFARVPDRDASAR